MGQQQLLLIVLGVILVGVAVVLGIQYFGVGAEQGAKDELVAHSQMIASNAQEWFKKPKSMGGGGNEFTGFNTFYQNNLQKMQYSTNGTYPVDQMTASAGQLDFVALPVTALGYDWQVNTQVLPDTIIISITGQTAP